MWWCRGEFRHPAGPLRRAHLNKSAHGACESVSVRREPFALDLYSWKELESAKFDSLRSVRASHSLRLGKSTTVVRVGAMPCAVSAADVSAGLPNESDSRNSSGAPGSNKRGSLLRNAFRAS